MPSKRKVILLSIAFILASWMIAAESADQQFPVTIQTMTDYIGKELKDNFGDDPDLYPGVSIAMVYDGKIVWATGFGHADIENNIPATADTAYVLASVSKNLAGAVNMWLYDQGRLELDVPVKNYLPEFAMKKRYEGIKDLESLITPRRLLNHHSGIPEEVESSGLFTYHHWAGYESFLMDYIKDDYPSQYPGEVAVYNNAAFDMTAILPSRITRQNFADLAREAIFEPLGMNSSAFGRVYENMAVGYDPYFGPIRPYSQAFGSDGATSSVNDMAQLLLMYLGLGTHPNGKKILNPATVTDVMPSTEMSTLDVFQPVFMPGLGWDNVDQLELQYAGPAFLKGGNDVGYNSEIAVMLDWKLGVVVIDNHGSLASLPNKAAIKCLQTAIEELGGPIPSNPVLPDVTTETDFNLIAGYYSGAAKAFIDKISIQDENSLEWKRNIFSEQPQTIMLSLDEDKKAFIDGSGQIPGRFYFKNMPMEDGNHFIVVTEKAPYMSIMMEKFTPGEVPKAWKERDGKLYLLTSFRHDGTAFSIISSNFAINENGGSDFLAVEGIPILPVSNELAFVAGQIVNRGDSCVRVSGKKQKEKILFNGNTLCRIDGIEEVPVGKMSCFHIPSNELCWRKLVISEAGEYYVNFPRNARAVILDANLAFTGQDSAIPWAWNCTEPGTYYVGLVAARPTNAFLELTETIQVLVKATATAGGTAIVDTVQVAAGKAATITATPDAGNIFLWWNVEAGDASITDKFSSKTTIIPQSNATAKANFANQDDTVTLALKNDGIGECDPVSQIHVRKDGPFTIKATPDDGFAFVEWQTVSGTVQVDNKYSEATSIVPSDDVVMKAVFRGNPIVAKDKSKVSLSAAGDPFNAKSSLRNAPLSSELLDNFSEQKITGVSCGGAYFPIDGNLKNSGVKVDKKKGTWSFSRKDITASSGDWNAGQLDFVLYSEDGVSCFDPHWNVTCRQSFSFDSKKQQQTPATITGTAMAACEIGKMTLKTTAGKAGEDSLKISGSTFELPDQATFPEDKAFFVTVGKLTLLIPSVAKDVANWKKKNDAYTYTSSTFYGGKVKAVFDMTEKTWSMKLDKAALNAANFADLPVVRLSIGNYEAASVLEIGQKLSLK